MPKHKVSPTYANSPIAKIITATLNKIDFLHQKYPLSPSQSATEHIHAYKTLQLIKSVLEKIHQNLLPLFDHYNNPGITGLIPDLLKIRDMSSPLFGISLEKFVFTIEHPMTFELAEFLAQMTQKLPKEIKTFIPFLDPDVFGIDLHSGFTGIAVNKALGFTFITKNQKSDDSSEPSYNYEYTLHNKGEISEGIIDGSISYQRFARNTMDRLLKRVRSFLLLNAEKDYTKSHIARVNFLSNLTEAESESINEQITEHTQVCSSNPDISDDNPFELIKKIDHEIQRNQTLLMINQELQVLLSNKATAYSTETILNLVERYPALKEQLNADMSAGLDVSYGDTSLPEWIIGRDRHSALLPIKALLDLTITQQQSILKKSDEELQAKLSRLKIYREESIGAWQQETLQTYSAFIKEQSSSLKELQLSLAEVNRVLPQSPPDDNSVEDLQQHIAAQQEQIKKLAQLQKQINLLIDDISNGAKLPSELAALDHNDIIQTAKNDQSTELTLQAKDLLKQIDFAQKASTKQLSWLHDRSEKMKSEALFAKSMAVADPTKMQALLNETSKQVEKLTAEQQQLQEKEQSLLQQIATAKEQIQKLRVQSKEKSVLIDTVNEKLHPLIDAIISRAQKHDTLNISIGEDNELINDYTLCETFIQNILQQINHLQQENSNTEQTERYNNDCVNLLDEVSQCLKQHIDKSDIPFKEINKLASIQKMSQEKGFKDGFDFLLSLLGLRTKAEIRAWKNYRVQQDDLFRFKPSVPEYLKYYDSLMGSIIKTQAQLETQAKEELQLQSISCFAAGLPKMLENIQHNFTEKDRLSAECADIELETQKQTDLSESLQQSYEETIQAQTTARSEKEQCQQNQDILNKIKIIIEGIESLKKQIQLLEGDTELSFNDETLYRRIAALQKTHGLLVETTKEVEKTSKKAAKAQVYQENIKTLNQLLESTQQSLVNTTKLKINLSPLQEQLSTYQESISKVRSSYEQLSKKFNSEQELKQFKDLITDFNQVYTEISSQNSVIETLKAHALIIEDKQTNNRVEAIQLSYDLLQQDMDNTGNLFLDDLVSILNKLKEDAHIFKEHAFQEDIETQKRYSMQLTLIKTHLSKLPSDEELPSIKSGDTKREHITLLRKEVTKQLAQSEKINMRLIERSVERNRLVNEILLPKLTDYWEKREKSKSMKLKDTLSPSDKNARFDFIQALQAQLEQYSRTGKSEEIISTIYNNIRLYAGAHLQPILHKISTEIGDLDLKIPHHYMEKVPADHDLEKQRSQADAILQKFAASNPDYVAAIQLLYSQIDKTAELGDDAKILANKLHADLNRFVITHSDKLPDEHAYDHFKKHFTSRLHSEDESMCKHRKAWKINLANFAIGFFTLGIAIGIKLIHSKINEGRCKFFFHETKREKQILSMEETVQDLAAPAA